MRPDPIEKGTSGLAVTPNAGAESPRLASFRFNGHGDGLQTGLEWLGGALTGEHWQVSGEVTQGASNGIAWRCANGLCFLSTSLPDDGTRDAAELTEDVYRRLLETACALDHPRLLRIWNYMPDINAGSGDTERYRRFCVGRARALRQSWSACTNFSRSVRADWSG